LKTSGENVALPTIVYGAIEGEEWTPGQRFVAAIEMLRQRVDQVQAT